MTSSWPFRRPIVLFDEADSPGFHGFLEVQYLRELADLPRRQHSDTSPSTCAALAMRLPVYQHGALFAHQAEPASGGSIGHNRSLHASGNKNVGGEGSCVEEIFTLGAE